MGRRSKPNPGTRNERKPRDNGKPVKAKPCLFCKEGVAWIDYKDVNVLRRYLSDRAKIKARRVTGNCVQHQRGVAMAIKNSRELALLPFATMVTSSRGGGRGGRDRGDRPDRPSRDDRPNVDDRATGDVVVDEQPRHDEVDLIGAGVGGSE